MRYKITIEYDGTGLAGWQAQNDVYSVQEALVNAINKATQQEVDVIAAGRTDAGVHAYGQVAHFELEKEWDEFRLKEALNFYLRDDLKLPVREQVAVISAEKVSDDFHARFSAKKRHYIYRITNRRAHLALDGMRSWCVHEQLDAEKMHKAAQLLVGLHDFTTLRSTECQAKSPVKTLDYINISRKGDLIEVELNAQSFLHHMVRNIVGTLRRIGNGKWQESDLLAALDAKDRRAGGETAPAHGLYFVKVDY
jgi:tRNA pseudouridine38-40 synthase